MPSGGGALYVSGVNGMKKLSRKQIRRRARRKLATPAAQRRKAERLSAL